MSNKKLMKKVLIISLSATMVFAVNSSVYAGIQALPNGTIVNQNGRKYLTDSNGEKYSGWFMDSKENWFYFNESDKAMKTGWHHDDKDGYWYYLNLSDGKMLTGWQTIDGKEYFFQPVRDMGNYHFNNEQEKWAYTLNSKVPYGAMYVNTTTPDGYKVGNDGVKVILAGNTTGDLEAIQTGWVNNGGNWYYYNADGILLKNTWLDIEAKWYYLSESGAMVKDTWKVIDGKSYYFGFDGVMYVNTTTPDGIKVNENGEKIINSQQSKSETITLSYLTVIGDGAIYVEAEDMAKYKWWEKHGSEVMNDSRIPVTQGEEREELLAQYYPDMPDGAWIEISIDKDYWSVTSEFGFGGHGIAGGDIIWTSDTTAIMKEETNNNYNNLSIIDMDSIEIDGTVYIRQ